MPNTYFTAKKLMDPPVERAAFSDRMAYLCAELSKLSYFKFEGGHTLSQAKDIVDFFVEDEVKARQLKDSLSLIINQIPEAGDHSKKVLADILATGGFFLEKTFAEEGTQAFLCSRTLSYGSAKKKIAYLVFRGTEPTQFKDIKTDLKANLTSVELNGEFVEFHTGFYTAYKLVEQQIKRSLDAIQYDQLFITGHSLGGALAVVCTRLLPYEIKGACYTYGAPPVGTIDIQNGLKTPVYQIVNETDIVPLLPNPWLASLLLVFLSLVKLLLRPFTLLSGFLFGGTWDERFVKFMRKMIKYEHAGYLSYLEYSGSAARLRYQKSFFSRLGNRVSILRRNLFGGFNKMLADHSIDLYVEKLKTHGERRN